MFEGPGPTMIEVDTQFSILIAHYLVKGVILNFPPFFFPFLKEIRVGKKIERFFFCQTGKTVTARFSESASESSYRDSNRPDLGRQNVDWYQIDAAGAI